ncbi:MAG: hypothetical protein IJ715_02755 [Bacilli bacterium]|nr:hypothetical protein [Bacilli bacterium]
MILVCFSNNIVSQIYYGKNNFGRLEFVNDSVYVASFYQLCDLICYDTGTYYKINDTLFLNSKVMAAFVVEKISKDDGFDLEKGGNDIDHIIKIYTKDPKNHSLYHLNIEIIGRSIFYDDIGKELRCPPLSLYKDKLIVLYDGFVYNRVKIKQDCGSFAHFKIKLIDDKIDRIYFDNFPLLIKKNKLIPIDKNKNEDCWINNGFYLPTMKKSTKDNKQFRRMVLMYRGIAGLNNCIDYEIEF